MSDKKVFEKAGIVIAVREPGEVKYNEVIRELSLNDDKIQRHGKVILFRYDGEER